MINARAHTDRQAGLKAHMSPLSGGQIVEVGTLYGQHARWMVSAFRPTHLAIADPYGLAMFLCNGHPSRSTHAFVQHLSPPLNPPLNLTCHRGKGVDLLRTLADSSQDLIYIDGDHEYKGVCSDLEAARTKVRVGGLIALNDYYRMEWEFLATRGRWGNYGIIFAVNEFLSRYGRSFEVAYTTFGQKGGGVSDIGIRRLR